MGSNSSKVGDYDLDLKSVIGEGGFGVVYKGTHKKTKEPVAIKKCAISSHVEVLLAMKEIKSMENIRSHDNIVKLLAFHFHNDAAWIVMELCELGDLEQYVKKQKPSLDDKVDIMLQCTDGVIHLHQQEPQIVHRDLKPRNILFRRERGKLLAKIGDFGLSKVVNNSSKLKTVGGTVLYMAPELMLGKDYDASVDVFALGLVFLAMMLLELIGELVPLSATAMGKGDVKPVVVEMCDAKMNGKPLPTVITILATDTPKERIIKQLIRDMVAFVPEKRMSLKRVRSELKNMLSMEPSHISGLSSFSLGNGNSKGSDIGKALLDILLEHKYKESQEQDKWKQVNEALLQLATALDMSNLNKQRLDTTGSIRKKQVLEYDSGVQANIDTVTEEDEATAVFTLLNAACNGDINTLKRLHLSGVDMSLCDYDGRTSLHLAAAEGHLKCVMYLLETCHVGPSPRDRWGHTPFEEAKNFNHRAVFNYLQELQE